MKIAIKGIFFFSFYLCSCIYDYGDGKLTLINNSSDTVYFKLIWDEDSSFLNSKNLIDTINYISSREIIKPKDSLPSVVHNISWENLINSRFSDSTLKIVFMSKNLFNKQLKDSLKLFHSKYKMYKFKVKQLNRMKWKVSYP